MRYWISILLLSCLSTVFGQTSSPWLRHLRTGKGPYSDRPPARPFLYFQSLPGDRNDPKDGVKYSAWVLEGGNPPIQKLRTVGVLNSLTVYELAFYLDERKSPRLQSVLIGRSKNELREIHVQENFSDGTIFPVEIVKGLGGQAFIKTKFDDGGMYHIHQEDYFAVSGQGVALLLDPKPLVDEASRVAPAGYKIYNPTTVIDFASKEYRIETYQPSNQASPKIACCKGIVRVPFRVSDGRIVLAGPGRWFASRQ